MLLRFHSSSHFFDFPQPSSQPLMHMAKTSLLFIACIVSLLSHTACQAEVLKLKWEVGYVYGSPDCEDKLVMAINGQFPGPTIRAKVGDTIDLELKNTLETEGVVIHWHGIRQRGTPWADGTAAISQCAINPEETFNYRFEVDQAGTYFYHGHYGMQRAAGLYGSLIVDVADGEEEPFHYDDEFNLLLSDWYHESIYEQTVGLNSRPMKWIGEPQVSDEFKFLLLPFHNNNKQKWDSTMGSFLGRFLRTRREKKYGV